MSIISAGTSNTTTLIYTGDTTGNLVFQSNGTTEAMRITAAQNVGIGVTNPGSPLTVSAAAGASAIKLHGIASNGNSRLDYFNNTGTTQYFAVSAYNAGVDLYAYTAIPMIFSTNATERMRIDSSGRVTTPAQPSFYAWSGVGNVLFTTETPLPLNSTLWNTGSHYNTSNYRFTAPVAGKYFFRANIYKQGNGNYSRLRIQKNDVSYTYHLILASSAETLTITSIVDMAVNDYVTCTFQADGGGADVYMASDHTSFSGFLIG